MGQDQVSGEESVRCWLAAPVAMFYGNLPNFVNKVKIGNKVMSQNVMLHLGEGDFIMFDDIPISTIKLSKGRLQTFPDISLSKELR